MHKSRQAHNGQVMILFAVATLVLIGAIALAVDVGYLLAERRQVQAAADAAAMAGAKSALDNKPGEVISAARMYATLNAGVPDGAVTVNPNASAPSGSGDADRYVAVTIEKNVQKFFLGAIYGGDWIASASAVAAVEPVEGNYALITLDKNREPGVYANGNTGIDITGDGGGAMSNTTMQGIGISRFKVEGALHAYGKIQPTGNWSAPDGIVGNRGRHIADPLADINPPNKGSEPDDIPDDCKPTCSLQPGLYKDWNITIHGTATLAPGVYYFQNSDIGLQNTNSTIQGTGVHLYFDSSSSFDPKNGNVYITAMDGADPESEPSYRDIALWFASCSDINPSGNPKMRIEGIFYAPCAHVKMNGTPGVDTVNGQVIVGSLEVKGTADLRIRYTKRVETPMPTVYLVQ